MPKKYVPISLAYVALAALPVQEAELPPALPVMLPLIVLATVKLYKLVALAGFK